MPAHHICILGGTGFVGSQLCQKLVKQGHQLKLLCRRLGDRRHLALLPGVTMVEADIHQPDQLLEHFIGCDVVINLTGILFEQGNNSFQRVHAELPGKIADVCQQRGIRRVLHMSALNAKADAPSRYLQSKAAGEEALHNNSALDVTSFRPSVIFGRRDSFFNKFASLLSLSPLMMPLPGAYARFAPVHVSDVARAFVDTLDNKQAYGQRLELCGPKQYSLLELINYLKQQQRMCCKKVLPLGPGLTSLIAKILQFVPGKPLTPDNVLSMQCDSLCAGNWPELLSFQPSTLEAIVPSYLGKDRRQEKLQRCRRMAGRDQER